MATPTIDRPGAGAPDDWHGPVEVRAALVPYATEATLAVFDNGLDEAYGESLRTGEVAPLRAFLEHWWFVAGVAENGMPTGQPTGGGAEQFRRAWEERHGQPFPAAL